MKADRWEEIDSLFHAALEREPAQRASFMTQACAGDEALRKEVESLIASHERAGCFIEAPAADLAAELMAKRPENAVGRTIGPYRVVDLLGAGGMGEVYLAEDTRLGRRVALKLLPAQFTQHAERLRRFEREARAASALNHPNILVIYDIGKDSGSHFIVTEFVEGETLRQRLARSRMGLGEIAEIAVQVTSALLATHQAGIIHRDIKPENIMIRPDGYIKLLDFGLAKLTESAGHAGSKPGGVDTSGGLVMGTVTYMSPEQARGRAVDARSDIFSLGSVLYEMITGRVPFEGETTFDVLVSLLEEEPTALALHVPEVPAEWDRMVKKAMAKGREERYQTANDLLIDLRNLKQDIELGDKPGAGARVSSTNVAPATTKKLEVSVDTNDKPAILTGKVASTLAASSVRRFWLNLRGNWKLAGAAIALLVITAAIVFFWR